MRTIITREPSLFDRRKLSLFDDDGFAVGHVKIERPASDVCYVYALFVAMGMRRRGHARRLLEEALAYGAAEWGPSRFTINALPFEDRECPLGGLVALYESLGFRTFNATDATHNMVMEAGEYLRRRQPTFQCAAALGI